MHALKEFHMDGFARRKEQSKEDIRKAAWELFSQFGVDKVSMTDIARKAGVSQATIYNNFGSKEALTREFVTTMVQDLVDHIQQIITPQRSYEEKMAAFFQLISAMMTDGRSSTSGSAVFTSSLDLQNDPEIKKIRMDAQEKMIALMLGLIEEGRQQGHVNPSLSDEALRVYFTVFMDVFTHSEFQRQYQRHPNLVHELGTLMMHGLSGR
jgi:AcrR family transcriptional regulator